MHTKAPPPELPQSPFDNPVGKLLTTSITTRIAHDATAAYALDLMYQFKTQHVAVMKQGRLVGIFTYADYLRNVLRSGANPEKTPVQDVMHDAPPPVDASQSCRDVFQSVCHNGTPYIPVEHNGRFLGLVSDDILRLALSRELHALHKKSAPLFSMFRGHTPDEQVRL